MRRLLLEHAKSGEATVIGARFHYLSRVLRLRTGDKLEVFDGYGRIFDARVSSMEDQKICLALGPARDAPVSRSISLVQGLPKGDKLNFVLQKGTELGVAAFAVATCARSVVKLSEKSRALRVLRWKSIVEEAARQCNRATVPSVATLAPLLDSMRFLPNTPKVFVLDEMERTLLLSVAFTTLNDARRPVALVVGPEGGFERQEIDKLVAEGATPVTLGSFLLRTETAALAAVTIVRHLDGELG